MLSPLWTLPTTLHRGSISCNHPAVGKITIYCADFYISQTCYKSCHRAGSSTNICEYMNYWLLVILPERFSLPTIKALDILCYNYFPICRLHQSVSFLNAGPMSHSRWHQVTSTATGIFIKDINQEVTTGLALSRKYNEQGSHNLYGMKINTHLKR